MRREICSTLWAGGENDADKGAPVAGQLALRRGQMTDAAAQARAAASMRAEDEPLTCGGDLSTAASFLESTLMVAVRRLGVTCICRGTDNAGSRDYG
jgi:hypothetical protein